MMGAHYADVFDRMDGVAVTACCDPTPWKLDAFAKDRGIPGAYVRFRDMVGSEALDGILNVTPDYLHAEVVRAAVDAGLPILTEKPLVGSLQEPPPWSPPCPAGTSRWWSTSPNGTRRPWRR